MIIIQNTIKDLTCPDDNWFTDTLVKILNALSTQKVINDVQKNEQLLVRIVDEKQSQALNKDYREQDKPTNILSFFADNLDELPDEVKQAVQKEVPAQLGELVICFSLIVKEAVEQEKTPKEHLTHLLIHGVLHLLGYDHMKVDEANIMQQKEDEVLVEFNLYLER